MSLEKRTVVDQFEVLSNGVIQVRLAKQLVDGGSVQHLGWHRSVFIPGTDIEAQISAINSGLQAINCAAVQDAAWDQLRAMAPVVWTEEVVVAYQLALAAATPPAPPQDPEA